MPMRLPRVIVPSPFRNSYPRVEIIGGSGRRFLVTPRQRDVYLYVRHWWRIYGYSPSYIEIADGLGLKASNGVGDVVNRLKELGVLEGEKYKKRTVRPSGIALARLIVLDGAAGYAP